MTVTLEDLLAQGQPQVIMAAIGQHPDLNNDRMFNRLYSSLQGDVNRYAEELLAETSTSDQLELRCRQLMARIEKLLDYQNIFHFSV
ncbi:MAG: hypothetical protein AAF597_07790, partial [Bacteroidota bacterium]